MKFQIRTTPCCFHTGS